MSDTPRNYVEHDDLCIWWENVGKEPLDYACTCGKWAEKLSASQSRVRELEGENERLRKDAERYLFCLEHGFPLYRKPRRPVSSFVDSTKQVGEHEPEYWIVSAGDKNFRGDTPTAAIDAALAEQGGGE